MIHWVSSDEKKQHRWIITALLPRTRLCYGLSRDALNISNTFLPLSHESLVWFDDVILSLLSIFKAQSSFKTHPPAPNQTIAHFSHDISLQRRMRHQNRTKLCRLDCSTNFQWFAVAVKVADKKNVSFLPSLKKKNNMMIYNTAIMSKEFFFLFLFFYLEGLS